MAEYKLSMTAAEVNKRLTSIPNKADLVNGQVPYSQTPRLTANKTLYVDATNGDDSNAGTQSKPFKTIQAAINSLPKNLGNYAATINVAAGDYNERIEVYGFTGGNSYRPFTIKGSSTRDETRKVRAISLGNNSTCIRIEGLYVIGESDTIGSAAAVNISGSIAQFSNISIKYKDTKTIGMSVGASSAAQVAIETAVVDGFSRGISLNVASVASIRNINIKNCETGISAVSAIAMGLGVSYENVTTTTVKSDGGQIFI